MLKKQFLHQASEEKQQREAFQGKSALDFFLNFLTLATLGWLALSVGGIIFQIINKYLSGTYQVLTDYIIQTALKSYLASAIIVLPIFLITSYLLHRQYRNNNLNHQSNIYRWLTYLILLVSLLLAIGSLVALLINFLNDDYTAKIILKILVIFAISLGIFGYYLYDLRRRDYAKRAAVSVAAFTVVLAISIIAIIAGLLLIDSPATARLKKFDLQRVVALSQINSLVVSSYAQSNKLPAILNSSFMNQLIDPQTKKPYEYQVLASDQYQICADFSLAAKSNSENVVGADEWLNHQAGHQCFTKKIDLQLINNINSAAPANQ